MSYLRRKGHRKYALEFAVGFVACLPMKMCRFVDTRGPILRPTIDTLLVGVAAFKATLPQNLGTVNVT